ncbi:TolC family protein [Gracilimonas mengyeensis]|uniref:Outer membrane protein TolC n=1 Tax=Gracilimonas mengyeensis TaxID=1302730 RepID=A0A521FEY7_9BACT|nr:TolC family protein [Gracilimonas mengyeensis]SMO94689.1 Outer membrane protein TolC [Gracilimonas mengyeensis]
METKNTKLVYLVTYLVLLLGWPASLKAQTLNTDAELHRLVHDAIASSQSVGIEQNNAQAAENNRKKAYQTYLPTISFTGSFTHLNDDITFPSNLETLLMGTQQLLVKEQLGMGFNDPLPPSVPLQEVDPIQEQDIWKATLGADMVLFSGLKVPYLAKAAEHQRKAHEALSVKEQTAIIRQTVEAYKSLALLQKSAEVLDNSERRLNEQRRYVDKAVNQGMATELETARINLAAQQLEEKRIELNAQRELVIALLQQLTGHPEEELKQLSPVLTQWETGGEMLDASHRPEMEALKEAQRATEFKKKSMYSAYLPQVKLYGRKELYEDDLSLLDPEWMVGVGLKWELFDGLKRSRDLQNAKIEVENSKLKKDLIGEQLQLNLTKAYLDLDKANQKIRVAEQQMHTAQRAYTISQKQYEVGLISQKDYLEAENDLQQAELSHSKALFTQNMAVIDYLIAGGKLSEAMHINQEIQ